MRFEGGRISGLEGCTIVVFNDEEYKNEFAVLTNPLTQDELKDFKERSGWYESE